MGGQPTRSIAAPFLILLLAVAGTAVMALLDAYEWFYRHSRDLEAYAYDEIVVFLSLFIVLGLLGRSNQQVRRANLELKRRRLAEAALMRFKQHLEDRVEERTTQLRAHLEERERAEKGLEASRAGAPPPVG